MLQHISISWQKSYKEDRSFRAVSGRIKFESMGDVRFPPSGGAGRGLFVTLVAENPSLLQHYPSRPSPRREFKLQIIGQPNHGLLLNVYCGGPKTWFTV